MVSPGSEQIALRSSRIVATVKNRVCSILDTFIDSFFIRGCISTLEEGSTWRLLFEIVAGGAAQEILAVVYKKRQFQFGAPIRIPPPMARQQEMVRVPGLGPESFLRLAIPQSRFPGK